MGLGTYGQALFIGKSSISFQKLESMSSADTNTNPTYAAALSGSLGKICSECIDQLQKWHEPLNCEEITKKQ